MPRMIGTVVVLLTAVLLVSSSHAAGLGIRYLAIASYPDGVWTITIQTPDRSILRRIERIPPGADAADYDEIIPGPIPAMSMATIAPPVPYIPGASYRIGIYGNNDSATGWITYGPFTPTRIALPLLR